MGNARSDQAIPASAVTAYPPTLPADWYVRPDVYAEEQARIFRRHWFLLAHEGQFAAPGDYVAGEAWGVPVAVVMNAEGALAGFLNCCRHRAGRVLADGAGRCNEKLGLRCRYHGWKYGFDGRLLVAPGFSSSADFDRADYGLFPIRVESWNGLVFVALSNEAEGLAAWLGDIVEIGKNYTATRDLKFLKTIEVEGAANWKLYGENGVEGYHLPFVHTWLAQAVGPNAYEVDLHPNGKFVGFHVNYRAWGFETPFKGYWILKFPGLLVHFSEVEFNVEQVIPAGVRRTRLKHFFWTPQDKPEIAGSIAEDWRTTMQEDMRVCEEVQRNLDAGSFRTGRMTPERERGAIYFQSLVREALENLA